MPKQLTRMLGISIAAAALALVPAHAIAQEPGNGPTETFTGTCNLTGTVHADNSPDPVDFPREQEQILGQGVCSGVLNAEPVEAVPVTFRAHGTGDQPFYIGQGSITFVGEAANIQFLFQQVGALAFVLQGQRAPFGAARVEGVPSPDQRPGNGVQFNATLRSFGLSG